MCFLTEIIVCVAYLRQKSRVNFRSTKVDAGKLKCKYLNRPWSTLAVNVLRGQEGWKSLGSKLPTRLITGYGTGWEFMYLPSYSLNLTPNDFHLFGPLKKFLTGKQFATDANLCQAVTSLLQTCDTDFFYPITHMLVLQWDRRLNVSCDYVEVWLYFCYPWTFKHLSPPWC
jgi:hypothetical protein